MSLISRRILAAAGILAVALASDLTVSRGRDAETASQRLIGTWRLVSAGFLLPDGTLEPFPQYGPNGIGYLMYDSTRHMCVAVANPNHQQWADSRKPTNAEALRSYDAFFGYCGKYEVHEKEGYLIHLPEMCSWPHYIGGRQRRDFRFEGDRLILSGAGAPQDRDPRPYRITWQRVR